MTKEEAIEQLENSMNAWFEFWGGASYCISEEDIEAIQLLTKLARKND